MDLFIIILFYILAAFLSIKTISYGIFEIKQQNKFGGFLVIFVAIASYLFFAIMMYLK